MNMFNWDDMGLPEYESSASVKERLDKIHKDALTAKGIPVRVDAGSPGFNPGVGQAREVAVMCALGLEAKEIALVINVDEKIVKSYYRRELDISHKISNIMVARKALEMAMSGRFPDMTKFWLKAQAKWKEVAAVEVSGPNGGPVEIGSARDKLARAMGVETPDGDGAEAGA